MIMIKHIYLKGTCNCSCFCCPKAETRTPSFSVDEHFKEWVGFDELLSDAEEVVIESNEIDPLLYPHLSELIDYIQGSGVRVSLVIAAAHITSDDIADIVLKCDGHIEIMFYSLNHRISAELAGADAYYESPNIFKVLSKSTRKNITVKTFICNNVTASLAKITLGVFHHYKDVMDLEFVVNKHYEYNESLTRLFEYVGGFCTKISDCEYEFRVFRIKFSDADDVKSGTYS